jgi:hypothetical protein
LIWEEQSRRVFGSVKEHFEIITSASCGTHVHVKPEEGDWELNAVKKLAKAIVVFAPIIAELLNQENIRVIFGVFVSGNCFFECFVFVKAVFQDLCLWI